MLRRSLFSAALMAIALSAAPAQAALQWSDNSFHLWGGPDFREPYDPDDIWKTILTYTHVDGYKWGGNFLNVDWLFSTSGEGDNIFAQNGELKSTGALEVYAVYRHELSLNKITGTNTFQFGSVVRDVAIVLGADVGTKNHGFSERKIMPTAGVRLAFNVPGFFNVDFLLNKEWGVAGSIVYANNFQPSPPRATSFDVTEDIAAAWGIPLYGPITFEGFGSVNFPKGNGGLDNIAGSNTVTEVLFHPKVMVDVAKLGGSSGIQLGVGYEYWLNKFGNDHNVDPSGGSFAHTFFGEVAVHL